MFKKDDMERTHREWSLPFEELPFTQLRIEIVELPDVIQDNDNVHQVIKNMVKAIRFLYNRSQGEIASKPKPATKVVFGKRS